MKPCPGAREPAAPALEARQPRPGRGRGRGSAVAFPALLRRHTIFVYSLGAHCDFAASVIMAEDVWIAAVLSVLVALLLIAALVAAAAAILAAAAALAASAAAGPPTAPARRRSRGRALARSHRARSRAPTADTHLQVIVLEAFVEQLKSVEAAIIAATAALNASTACSRGLRATPDSDAEEAGKVEDGCAHVNSPFTAVGIVSTVLDQGGKAFVLMAAASQLGQMIVRHCRLKGMALISVVRNPEQVELLQGMGAELIVDNSSAGWEVALGTLIRQHKAHFAFDAESGKMAGDILTMLPWLDALVCSAQEHRPPDQQSHIFACAQAEEQSTASETLEAQVPAAPSATPLFRFGAAPAFEAQVPAAPSASPLLRLGEASVHHAVMKGVDHIGDEALEAQVPAAPSATSLLRESRGVGYVLDGRAAQSGMQAGLPQSGQAPALPMRARRPDRQAPRTPSAARPVQQAQPRGAAAATPEKCAAPLHRHVPNVPASYPLL